MKISDLFTMSEIVAPLDLTQTKSSTSHRGWFEKRHRRWASVSAVGGRRFIKPASRKTWECVSRVNYPYWVRNYLDSCDLYHIKLCCVKWIKMNQKHWVTSLNQNIFFQLFISELIKNVFTHLCKDPELCWFWLWLSRIKWVSKECNCTNMTWHWH